MAAEIKVTGKECKFVTYTESLLNHDDDMCLVKEVIHYSDGTSKPNLKMIPNFNRSYYVTKESFRTHEDKKESESLNKVQEFKCNDRKLLRSAAKALGRGHNARTLKQLARVPYLYGADVTSPTIIKREYQQKFPDAESANRVAVLDVETDMFSKTKDIISMSVTSKDIWYLAVVKTWFDASDAKAQIEAAVDKYLSKHKKDRNAKLEIVMVDTAGQAVVKCLEKLHSFKPDFVTCWNIDFDVNRMLDALDKDRLNPADVFSDPSVPQAYRFYQYKPAPTIKVMASGRSLPVPFQERLNMFYTTSSFQWIDSMVLYALIRKARGQLPNYKLDSILLREIGERKLKFKEADGLEDGDWHSFMQVKYKAEYMAYNIFDCVGVEMLDESTSDISMTINGLIGFSELKNFTSTPTQLADDLHFVYLDTFKEVISSKSDRMADDNDKYVIDMTGHIITLATHLNDETGIKPFKDFPRLQTLIRRYVVDLDVKSAYPYAQIIENISKSTTRREVISIKGVSDQDRRKIGYNLTAGRVNAVEYCTVVHKVPQLVDILQYFDIDESEVGSNLNLPRAA